MFDANVYSTRDGSGLKHPMTGVKLEHGVVTGDELLAQFKPPIVLSRVMAYRHFMAKLTKRITTITKWIAALKEEYTITTEFDSKYWVYQLFRFNCYVQMTKLWIAKAVVSYCRVHTEIPTNKYLTLDRDLDSMMLSFIANYDNFSFIELKTDHKNVDHVDSIHVERINICSYQALKVSDLDKAIAPLIPTADDEFSELRTLICQSENNYVLECYNVMGHILHNTSIEGERYKLSSTYNTAFTCPIFWGYITRIYMALSLVTEDDVANLITALSFVKNNAIDRLDSRYKGLPTKHKLNIIANYACDQSKVYQAFNQRKPC